MQITFPELPAKTFSVAYSCSCEPAGSPKEGLVFGLDTAHPATGRVRASQVRLENVGDRCSISVRFKNVSQEGEPKAAAFDTLWF